MPARPARPALDGASATRGRVAVYFTVRYLTPAMVVLALAASGQTVPTGAITVLLTAQVVLALLGQAFAFARPSALGPAIWSGMVLDLSAITALVAVTGGPGGPLSFLFIVHVLAAGILLSSKAGIRMLVFATSSLLAMDIVMISPTLAEGELPKGLISVAVLWIIGGAGNLFSRTNERELRRRTAELDTIRQVTLDIEQSLTLEEIFDDLCRGVCERFGFGGAAVLLREGDEMRCSAGTGITGSRDAKVPLAGRVAHALAVAAPVVTTSDQARADGTLLPVIGTRGYLAVPIAEDGLLIVTREGRKGRPGTVRAHEIEALDRLAHHARLAIGNARLHARVRAMAITDSLTGLTNHGELQRRLAFECGRLQRYATLKTPGHRMSVLLLDIDKFKVFNDRHGHQAGDAVLKGLATALGRSIRSFDVAARYGGEEFAVILPETGADAANVVAERIRDAVASYPFATRTGQKPASVTVSIGIATAPENGADPAELIGAADAALYHAKDAGRNRVVHADDVSGPGARVVKMDATRRRRAQGAPRARAASQPARARSSRPKRRTPRA
jgi:diguanylate cyclase (GGDEF)-like protein